MKLCALYRIDGKSLPMPDAGVEMSFQDVDGPDAGRDEAGYMHRSLLRRKVGSWSFCYSVLTGETYSYLQQILPKGGSFQFTCPDPEGGQLTVSAYLSGYSLQLLDGEKGLYKNLKFTVVQC